MPADRLPPGLYERLLSLALDREIAALDLKQFAAITEAPTETERPRLVARYIHSLLSDRRASKPVQALSRRAGSSTRFGECRGPSTRACENAGGRNGAA